MKSIYIVLFALLLIPVPNAMAQEKELPPEGGTPKNFNLPEKEV